MEDARRDIKNKNITVAIIVTITAIVLFRRLRFRRLAASAGL